jgi:hypothetical protein
VRYVNLLKDNADKALFFSTFAVGSLFIIVFKIFSLNNLAEVTIPSVLIVAYAVAALRLSRFRLREDRVAENCYYIGLLFTLVSLAYALYSFTANVSATGTIITNFGVALSTTIIGLSLRVLISQLREDPVEYEREARLELSEVASKLSAELISSVEQFATFRRSMQQVIEESMTEVARKANASVEDTAGKVATASAAVLARFESAVTTIDDKGLQLNASLDEVVRALQAISGRIESIDLSSEMVSRKFDPIVGGFRTLLQESTDRASNQAAEFSRITLAADAANAALDRLERAKAAIETSLHTGAGQLVNEFESGVTAVARMSQSITGLSETAQREIANLRQVIAAMENMLAGDVQNLSRLRKDAQAELELASTLVTTMHNSLISLAGHIESTVHAAS